MLIEQGRDVESIRLPRWGRVVRAVGVVPWLVLDPDGVPVEPVRRFLADFVARGNRESSVRSYAYDLLRWWRWLGVVGVEWDRASASEVRDLVLWLGYAVKTGNMPRTVSAATAGTVNPITRKRNLGDGYGPRTVRHSNAVLRSFYQYWLDCGVGLVNPVPLDRGGRRSHAHHNPLDPFGPQGRVRYNPRVPKPTPREVSDERWRELFGVLRCNRDRAMLAVAVSSAARASELLGMTGADVDWGDQRVRVHRKGSGVEQWLPASSEAFVWLMLYLADLRTPIEPAQPLWWTSRRRDHGDGLRLRPVSYEALRAVIRRANAALGTNWSMHDLRHTCALRMARDENLSLKDVQVILGHAHLSTTADIYLVEEQARVISRVSEHLAARRETARESTVRVAEGYDAEDLSVLIGDLLS